MRTIVVMLLTSAVALRLAGQSGAAILPTEVTVHVGDTVVLAGSQHPGGFSCGFPYHHDFTSDMPSVATVRGFVSGRSACEPDQVPENGVVYVTAVAPGIAHVRAIGCCGDLATITVPLPPAAIYAQHTRAVLGQQVTLTAVLPGYDQTAMFFWYRGRIGDYSRPIRQSADPHLTFIGTDLGVSYVWVQVFEGSLNSAAEIGIEMIPEPRRRAAQH